MSRERMLFILNGDKQLEINKFEAKDIPEFKALFDRATPLVSDPTGTKGHLACAEIHYLYLVYDIRSIYFNLDLEARKERARVDAKLPEQWKEDKMLAQAVEAYKREFKLTSAGNAYASAERAYYTLAEDTNGYMDDIVEFKALLKKKSAVTKRQRIGDQELLTAANEYAAILEAIGKAQKTIMANINDFGKLGDNVKALAEKFIASGGSLRTPVGGGTLGRREE